MNVNSLNDVLNQWNAFLSASPKNYIRIKNGTTGRFVTETTNIKPSCFFRKDITAKFSSISEWFDDLIFRHDISFFSVHFRSIIGSGSGKVEGLPEQTYDVQERLKSIKAKKSGTPLSFSAPQAIELPPTPTIAPQQAQPIMQQQSFVPSPNGLGAAVMQNMGGLAAAANAAGLGLGDFIDLKKDAERGKEYKEQLDKLKVENESLVIKTRDLESQVAHAQRDKDLALQLERLDKRGFLDTEAGQTLLASLPQMVSAIASARTGQQPAQLGAPGQNLSEAKRKLIAYLSDQNVSDQTTTILEHVLALTEMQPQFGMELKQLIEKHYGTKLS